METVLLPRTSRWNYLPDCFLALDGENHHANSVSVCRLSVHTLVVVRGTVLENS